MKYNQVISGTFVRRLNRFLADVIINYQIEQVHIKNTGRLKELLVPDAKVLLEVNDNPNRKTKYSIIAVYKNDRLVNIDSLAPNNVVYQAIKHGQIPEIGNILTIKREVLFGNSRFDLYFENNDSSGFIEVKGVTLEHNDIAMFPDAPTYRGTKHIYELIKAQEDGYKGIIFFLIQMQGCKMFTPHLAMDKGFTQALIEAYRKGVSIIVYDAFVTEDQIVIGNKVPFYLPEIEKVD